MKIWKRFARKSRSKSLSTLKNYYTRIDELDMYRYKKAVEGDLTALRIEGGNKRDDIRAMNRIEQSFLDEMGMNKRFEELMRLKNQLAKLQADYIIKDERYLLNLIRQKETQIRSLEEKLKGGLDIMQAKTILDKWLGVVIDLKKITVLDFYTKLKEYERNS